MKHRAFTLIEMVAVITISTALLSVAVVMLAALLKSEGSSRRHLEFCNTLNRLDEQFRTDVHAAASANPIESGAALEIALPPPSKLLIRYRCQPKEISREEVEGEKTLRRESYAIPEEVKSSIEMKSEASGSIVVLQIEPKPVLGTKIHYPSTRVEVVLSRDRRFELTKTN